MALNFSRVLASTPDFFIRPIFPSSIEASLNLLNTIESGTQAGCIPFYTNGTIISRYVIVKISIAVIKCSFY